MVDQYTNFATRILSTYNKDNIAYLRHILVYFVYQS